MLRFEVTNGVAEFACRIDGKVKRFAAGEHEVDDAPAELIHAVSCAHFAQAGVVVHEGLDEDAVEPDEESRKLGEAYEAQQRDLIASLMEAAADAEGEGRIHEAEALRAEALEVTTVHRAEVGE